MKSSLEQYYIKKNQHITLDNLTKKKLERRMKRYYEIFKENDNKEPFAMIYEFYTNIDDSLTYKEAEYIYNLCRNKYLNEISSLPVEENEEEEVEQEDQGYEFNNLNEWAEDRAKNARKFKDPEFYMYLVNNYFKYKQKDLMKLLEKEFKLKVPEGYIGSLWREYLAKVEVKEV